MPAEEIADLCFSEAPIFHDADHLRLAITRSSWVRVITRRMNFQWFPIHGPGRLGVLIGEVSVEGVKARDLLPRIQYPVDSVSDLLEKLVQARRAG